MSEPHLLRSSTTMAVGTVISRVTGMVRNLLIVAALGTALFADTYNVANTIPNITYILIAGGALNAVFVPQLVRAMQQSDEEGSLFASRLLTAVSAALLVVSTLAVIGAPWLIRIYASRFTSLDREFDLVVAFARYCLPQVFFYGLYAMLGQIATAKHKFGPMMWSPILNNLVVIATMTSFMVMAPKISADTITNGQVAFLGLGTTLGIAIQALVLIPSVRRAGVKLRPRFDLRGSGLGHSGRLAAWSFLFVIVNQLGYLGIVNVATAAAVRASNEGLNLGVGYTPYSNAYLIFLLPHAIITVSIITALLPRMSKSAVNNDKVGVMRDTRLGLEMIGITIVPSAFALAAFAPMITTLLYASTNTANARQIGWILAAFALGLIPFSAQQLLLRVFYAYEDTKTPLVTNVVINGALIGGALISLALFPARWVTTAMAGTYTISYFLGLLVTLALLRKRIDRVFTPEVRRTYAQATVAALISLIPAGLIAWGTTTLFGTSASGSGATLLIAGPTMLACYLVLVSRMKVTGVDELWAFVRDRLHR